MWNKIKNIFAANEHVNKKGQGLGFNSLINIAVLTMVLGIVITITFVVLQDLFDAQATNSLAANATNTTMQALLKLPDNLGTLILIAVFAVIIGFVAFFRRASGA